MGAGFAGSLTALGLHQLGHRVLLIEKNSHPRFAIGESSTPIADMILRDLAKRYDLPWLNSFSRYGSWQEAHPEIACGRKRGFSYYHHRPGQPFQTDANHSHELLVAASANDRQSDTNWYRSELDAFLVDKVQAAGIDYLDQTTVTSLHRLSGRWKLETQCKNRDCSFTSSWLIDATGSDALLTKLGISTGTSFRTHSTAIYSHFTGVKPWREWLHEHHISTGDYPYHPDWSALHHILEEGWLWMLRFNNGITSAGLVLDPTRPTTGRHAPAGWNHIIGRYPSLATLFEEASFAAQPGHLIITPRLQRRTRQAAGEGWIALPHTVGFVDPLHSTGIAHTLCGVERILHAFEAKPQFPARFPEKYEQLLFREFDFIDLLVAGSYKTRSQPELFATYSMLYFTAAIHYEQRRLQETSDMPRTFLSADHPELYNLTLRSYQQLQELLGSRPVPTQRIRRFRQEIQQAIAPYNIAGLLEPEVPNMYRHTTADF